jgi:hypothetical protein
MFAIVETVTLFSASLLVLFSVYWLALGAYGFFRTGLLAYFLIIVASVLGLGVSIANVALIYDSYIGIRILGQSGWKLFYYTFVCVQPVGALLSVIAMTLLTLWITRRV